MEVMDKFVKYKENTHGNQALIHLSGSLFKNTDFNGRVTLPTSKSVYTSEPALTNKQGKVCMARSKSLCRRTNRGSVYNTL